MRRKVPLISVVLLTSWSQEVKAFSVVNTRSKTRLASSRKKTAIEVISRREWLAGIATASAGFSMVMGDPIPANAIVYVDPDRYGDKELKVATVNKLRQTIRDSILKDPKLAPLFLRIAIQAALTYDASTQQGGPDGSIVNVILSPDAPSSLASLVPAASKLVEIEKSIKRATEVTMSDVVAFSGAEAIESAGGPRVLVQLGRLDPNQVTTAASYPDLGTTSNQKDIISAFQNSGLTERDVALLFGILSAIETVVSKQSPKDEEEEEEEENEMGDKDVFIQSSFGGPSQIYGEQLGIIDKSYFKTLATALKQGKPCASVFKDDGVEEWVAYYASRKGDFLKDVPEAYTKLMALGTRYTGGKVGSLLGGGEADV